MVQRARDHDDVVQFAPIEQRVGDREGRAPGIEVDAVARRDEPGRRPRRSRALRGVAVFARLDRRLPIDQRVGRHRAAVHPHRAAVARERAEVGADRHLADAEFEAGVDDPQESAGGEQARESFAANRGGIRHPAFRFSSYSK